MNFLGNFLSKFTVLLEDSETTCRVIIETILETTGIKLEPKELTCREGVIKLTSKPIFKTEIKLREEEIIQKLNDKLPKTHWQKIT